MYRRRSGSRDDRDHKKKRHKDRSSKRESRDDDSVERYYKRITGRVMAGIPTKFSRDPDPSFNIKYQTPQEKLEEYKRQNPNINATVHNKTDRQLYIGNLPPDITIPEIVKHLNDAMYALNLCEKEDRPIVDAWISSDGHYAFVEFRTIKDAHLGFHLTQISIHGYALKVGKPRIANSSYAAAIQQHAQNKFDDVVKISQQASGGFINPSALAASSAVMNHQFDNILKSLPDRVPGRPGDPMSKMSSASLIKSKVFTVTKLLVSNLPIEYKEDQIKDILAVVGKIKHLEILTDPNTGKYKGEVYVQYENEEDSRRAETTLMGMNIKDAYLHVKKVQSTTKLQTGDEFLNDDCGPSC